MSNVSCLGSAASCSLSARHLARVKAGAPAEARGFPDHARCPTEATAARLTVAS